VISDACKKLINELNIDRFIETGTDKGETVAIVSRWFSELYAGFGQVVDSFKDGSRSYSAKSAVISYPIFSNCASGQYEVHSVDVDEYSYSKAKNIFKSNSNVYLHHKSSEQFLKDYLKSEVEQKKAIKNYFFFLDAHWGEYWPLRDEIQVIRELDKFIIVVDDFMVPGKSDVSEPHGAFGFDIYKGRVLNWRYIHDLFDQTDVRIFYPSESNRDNRGWILITCGYMKDDLLFLSSLPLFEMEKNDSLHVEEVKPNLKTYMDGMNIIKKIIPVSMLRSMHRVYEKMMHRP